MALQVACENFIEPSEITCDCDDLSEAVITAYIEQASDIITMLTGGLISGTCEDVVRPRQPRAAVCGCSSAWSCTCSRLSGVTLRGPNPDVSQVLIDGAVFTDWVVVDEGLLLRSDGQAWPGCQDVTKPSTETGTFEITYTYGMEPPQLAKDACAEIVCSFLRSPSQNQRSTHPRARGMSIAGVQISLEQQVEEIRRKAFLMPYVIRLLTVYAPDGPMPAVVYSPELEDGWNLHRVYETGS
jgi:hypothetical protein